MHLPRGSKEMRGGGLVGNHSVHWEGPVPGQREMPGHTWTWWSSRVPSCPIQDPVTSENTPYRHFINQGPYTQWSHFTATLVFISSLNQVCTEEKKSPSPMMSLRTYPVIKGHKTTFCYPTVAKLALWPQPSAWSCSNSDFRNRDNGLSNIDCTLSCNQETCSILPKERLYPEGVYLQQDKIASYKPSLLHGIYIIQNLLSKK